MKVYRLHVINNGSDEDVAELGCRLVAWRYKLVRVSCGGEVVDEGCVFDALFKMCVDELEFSVNKDVNEVISDLYYLSEIEGVDISGMEFIAEVRDGYVYIPPKDVKRILFNEEIIENEKLVGP